MINLKNIFSAVVIILVTILSVSCKRDHDDTGLVYAPNMYEPVGYEPYKQDARNKVNPMGLNMRQPAAGTVSRPNYHTTFGEGDSTVSDIMIYNIPKDSITIAERVLTNPVPLNEKVLEEGKILYGRYCIHCHGEQGKGDGLVGKVYKGVPSYSADAYRTMNDGHVYHVITYGKGRMWPHGSQITPEERWKIVHYVHTLQELP